MRPDSLFRCLLAAGLLAGCVESIPAQQTLPLDSLFLAHRLPMSFAGDSASGPGWNFLVEQAATAQFVMVGESHYVREIPLFTSQLFRALHGRSGFQYLALEDGPWAIGMLMAAGVRGDADATFAMATRYRNALQFFDDQDVDLIVTAGRTSTSRGAPVWGLDQTWGTLHILERLRQLVPAGARAATVERLIDRARAVEAYRPEEDKPRFITDSLKAADLVELRRAAGGVSAEADRLLDMLQTSFEIYSSRTDGPAIYRSNERRERYMKARFVEEYDAARAPGDSLPRVLLKLGQWHAIRGVLNWGSIQSLGTFVSEFAHGHRMESLHIWTGLVDEPGRYWTLSDTPDYVSLAKAGSTDRWWVVDLRPIRPFAAGGKVAGMNEEMRKVIFGFDLALLIGNGNRATYERLIATAHR
jgi:hypothetical protein